MREGGKRVLKGGGANKGSLLLRVQLVLCPRMISLRKREFCREGSESEGTPPEDKDCLLTIINEAALL